MESKFKNIASKFDKTKFQSLHEEMSFAEYINKVYEEPKLIRTAYQRIYDMIMSKGHKDFERYRKKFVHYNFFDGPQFPIFGLEEALNSLVKFIRGAAGGYGTEKRVLLLHGPVGSSKSTICRRIKKGLEEYSASPEGKLYTFKWVNLPTGADGIFVGEEDPCPMHEEPLKLANHEMRQDILADLNEILKEKHQDADYTLNCNGDLCPRCKKFMHELLVRENGDWEKVVEKHIRVMRLVLSEADRKGIATFQPKDEKNQDATELTGDINFRLISHFGVDSDPRCVVENTLIATDTGFRKIKDFISEDLPSNEFESVDFNVSSINGISSVNSVYNGGKQEVVKLITRLNYSLTCTKNHKVLVMSNNGYPEWKRVCDINTGDYIALNRKAYVFGQDVKLPSIDYKFYGNERNIPKFPEKMCPEFAYLLGLWVGDGHYYVNEEQYMYSFGWTQKELSNRVEFSQLFKDLIGFEINQKNIKNHSPVLEVGSRHLYEWFTKSIGLKIGAVNKSLPDCVLQSSKESILAALEGLFITDGNLRDRGDGNTAGFYTISTHLATQVHWLLLSFGVVSSLYRGSSCWEVRIYGNNVNILCDLIPKLKDKFTTGELQNKKQSPNVDIVPNVKSLMKEVYRHTENRNKLKTRYSGNIHDKNKANVSYQTLADFIEDAGKCECDAYHELKNILDNNYVWLPIQDIVTMGTEQVYDLSVVDTHAYWANGFVSHNSFSFDGEFCVANRGMVEFIEMLKLAQEFLYDLLGASQERQIKPKKFPQISIDEAIVGHSVSGSTPIPYKYDNKVCWSTLEKMYDKFQDNTSGLEVLAYDFVNRKTTWTPVVSLYRHKFTGAMYKTCQKWGVVETTPNHSIYGRDGKYFYPTDKKEVMAVRDNVGIENLSVIDLCEYVPELSKANESFVKIPQSGFSRVDKPRFATEFKTTYDPVIDDKLEDLLILLAWYITEGHVSDGRGVVISQANKEELLRVQKSVSNISSSVGHISGPHEDGCFRLELGAEIFEVILEPLCGRYSENKKIPDFVFSLRKDLRKLFLSELNKTDGSTKLYSNIGEICSVEYKNNYFEYKTVSQMLAAQVGFLASSLDFDYSIYNYKTVSDKTAYRIRYVSGSNKQGGRHIRCNCRLIDYQVDDIWVYDIECENIHNFACGVGLVVCHNTNEPEFKKLQSNVYMEALKDRTVKIDVPYLIRWSDEIKVLEQDYGSNKVRQHIAPHTIEIAALWAVLTRLENDEKLTLIQKAKLYNGESITGYTEDSVKEMRDKHPEEGHKGISVRYIQDTISNCLSEHHDYINAFMVMNQIREGLDNHSLITNKEDIARYHNCTDMAIKELDSILKDEVRKALVGDEQAIIRLCTNYIDNVMAYNKDNKVKNKITGRDEAPNERLMRSVEEKIGVQDQNVDDFRRMIAAFIGDLAHEGKEFKWDSNNELKKAFEAKLFEDTKNHIRLSALTSEASVVSPEEQVKIDAIKKRLIKQYGYNDQSATDVLEYVGGLFQQSSDSEE